MVFKKHPHLCTRLGKSKNHIAKSILKSEKTPTQHKGRIVPLYLVEKVENELQKLIDYNQVIRLEKFLNDLFVSLLVITVKIDKSIKISTRFRRTKQSNPQKQILHAEYRSPDLLAMQISTNKNKEVQCGSERLI